MDLDTHMNDYLKEIQSSGYLVLNESHFNFDDNLISNIHNIFNKVRVYENNLFKEVRYHQQGTRSVESISDLNKLIKSEEHKKLEDDWFQLWRSANIEENDWNSINEYLNKISNTIYNVTPTNINTQYTCFTKGCGIIPHIDKNEHSTDRMCAILSYFSEDWKEEYGGCLRLDDKKTIVPNMGTIVILDFTKNNVLHEVTDVVADKSRFCLTTFLDYNK